MTKLTIKQVKELLASTPSQQELELLASDERKGVQTQLQSYYKKQAQLAQKQEQFAKRLTLERQLWQQDIDYIAGIDEVGRGPLAGPVVSAAVILPHDFNLVDVNDSKQLSEKKREELYLKILEVAVSVSIGIADNQLIDDINIYQATRQAMKQAVENLSVQPQHLLIDAMQIDSQIPQDKLIKGDAKSASIAAASIVAKVYRDHLMTFYDRLYPGYDFAKNDGYGTKNHLAGLESLGITPIHRLTFEPVKSLANS